MLLCKNSNLAIDVFTDTMKELILKSISSLSDCVLERLEKVF